MGLTAVQQLVLLVGQHGVIDDAAVIRDRSDDISIDFAEFILSKSKSPQVKEDPVLLAKMLADSIHMGRHIWSV